jgi:rhamnogalacturonan endolyase
MLHGTHYQSTSNDDFRPGRTWGPWLWYLNNGSIADAKLRARRETVDWPYAWMVDSNGYNSRGSISGKLLLSDGLPATGAAVFLGDRHSKQSTLDQGANYYYRTNADSNGRFRIGNARVGTYNLQAWPNGGSIGDVVTVLSRNDIDVRANEEVELGNVVWKTTGRKKLFQVGEMDRKATGFNHAGPPREHNRGSKCPPNISYIVGESRTSDWCFVQGKPGSWAIHFDVGNNAAAPASLSISLAAYSGGIKANVHVNGVKVGDMLQRRLGKPDPAVYRSGTLSGEWRLAQFDVPAGTLKNGANTVDISVHANESQLFVEDIANGKMDSAATIRGFMYDSIILEH